MPIVVPFLFALMDANATKGEKAETPMKQTPATDFNGLAAPKGARPSLRFDVNDWLAYLEDDDATEDQKVELVETLWSIVLAFVDIGWEVTSAPEICGETLDLKALLEAGMVDLSNQPSAKGGQS